MELRLHWIVLRLLLQPPILIRHRHPPCTHGSTVKSCRAKPTEGRISAHSKAKPLPILKYFHFLLLLKTIKTNLKSFLSQVSHIEVEQEQVSLPLVKPTTNHPPMTDHGTPFQLLLVPSSSGSSSTTNNPSRTSSYQRRGAPILQSPSGLESRFPIVATAISSPPERVESGTVSVGLAVQVSASNYVPPKRVLPPGRRADPPPPIPPRTVVHMRPSSQQTSSLSRPCSSFLEHPLLEESDAAIAESKSALAASSSQEDDSDVENSQSGRLACVSNANDTSIESLVLEETTLLLPAATSAGRTMMRNINESDENTLI